MKTIRNFSVFALTLSLALALQATPNYWAAAYTAAYGEDTTGGKATGYYSGYYCTVAKAQELFGSSEVDAVTAYLKDNYIMAQTQLAEASAAYLGGAGDVGKMGIVDYANGQYGLKANYGNRLASVGSEYLAMLFYNDGQNRAVRAMVNDYDDTLNGNAFFTDNALASSSSADKSGAWVKTIPEPTSGLLLLLGVAGLALRRKRK